MGGVHHPGASLGLALLPLVVHRYGIRLVVGEEHHVRPLLHHGRDAFAQLRLPAVIGPHLVRLLELAHLCVGRHRYVDPCAYHLLQEVQEVQEAAELLLDVCIALPIPEALYAGLLVPAQDMFDAQHLGPVGCVDDQGAADLRMGLHVPGLLHQHRP